MATVKLTQSVRWEILRNLGEEYRARIAKIEKQICAIPVTDSIFNARVSAVEKDAVLILGEKWLTKTERAMVSMHLPDLPRYNWYVAFPTRLVPHGFEYGNPHNEITPDMPEYAELAELVRNRADVIKESEQLTNEIKALLSNATTLNKVRDLWPSVVTYVHKNWVNELNAPVVKQTRNKPVPLELTDEAKVSLIKLNLTRQAK